MSEVPLQTDPRRGCLFNKTKTEPGRAPASPREKGIKSELSGNEDYYTACYLLVILKNSCSKLHRQKVFD